jgi:hypothetical protein
MRWLVRAEYPHGQKPLLLLTSICANFESSILEVAVFFFENNLTAINEN